MRTGKEEDEEEEPVKKADRVWDTVRTLGPHPRPAECGTLGVEPPNRSFNKTCS